jgi:glutaredoxin
MDAAQPARVKSSRRAAALVLALVIAVASYLVTGAGLATPEPRARDAVAVEVYTREGCPRCDEAKAFLAALSRERPELLVVEHSIDSDPEARRALLRRLREAGFTVAGVPAFVVRGELLVGFDDAGTTGERIRSLVDQNPSNDSGGGSLLAPGTCGLDADSRCEEPADATEGVDSRFLGRISVSRLGLPLFTIALGLLDGFNPCAMWVLLFLLGMLAGQRDRKRMAITAGTFVLASGVVYYAFMAAWLNVFLVIGYSHLVQVVLGLIAVAIGALNTKDFFAFRRGPSLSIPASVKPSIYTRVRKVLRADTLAASVFGVAVLAVMVNFVELLCTAGFPAVYTSVLARMELSAGAHAAYLGLYNLAYILDDAVMVTLAVVTLSRRRLSEAAGRWLKLASGAVMLALGFVLLLAPEWLG